MAPRTRHGPRRDSSPAEPVPEDRTLRSVSLVRAAQGGSKFKLARDPIARRGATFTKPPASLASIGTRQDNASDSEENNQEDEGDSVQGGEDGDEAGSEEMDNEERWQVMQQLLPDLSGAAGGLMTLLTDADYGNKLFRTVLKAKWASFTSIREHYQPPGTDSLFIDWLPLQARDAAAETGASVTRVLAQANSLTALNEMQRILAGLPSGKLALLEALDTAFPSLFTPRGHVRSFPDMVLGIRTCYLIELLASHEDRASVPHNTVARVFCEPNGRTNSERLCRYGPFRSLNCQADGESGPPCEQRIATILGHVTEDRRSLDVTRLRETFPLEELLKSLKQWMTSEFVEIDKTGREASQGEASNDHDDGFSGESPPIVRHSSLENNTSLFDGRASVLQLEATGRRRNAGQRRQERQEPGPRTTAPQDHERVPHRDSLRMPPPPPVAPTPRQGRKRPWDDSAEAADDESDPFEQDTRPVKALAVRPADRSQSLGANRASSATARPSHAGSPGPPEPYRRLPSPPAATAGYTRRRPWSEADTALLIELVGATKAAWSKMEELHNDRFEHPRNQQAYRDKARNLKVDMLARDLCLPPYFDLVVLGPKEVNKVKGLGKNPKRREHEVDEQTGTPYNTELLL